MGQSASATVLLGMDAMQTLLDWQGLLTVPQAAQLLATSPSTLRKWPGAGAFPGYGLNGEWRLNPADVLTTSLTIVIIRALSSSYGEFNVLT